MSYRVGSIVAKGNLRSVQIEGAGVSKVYLKGSLRTVYVDLNGISQVHLAPTSGLFCSLQYKLLKMHTSDQGTTRKGTCKCRVLLQMCSASAIMCLLYRVAYHSILVYPSPLTGIFCSNARQKLAAILSTHDRLYCLL